MSLRTVGSLAGPVRSVSVGIFCFRWGQLSSETALVQSHARKVSRTSGTPITTAKIPFSTRIRTAKASMRRLLFISIDPWRLVRPLCGEHMRASKTTFPVRMEFCQEASLGAAGPRRRPRDGTMVQQPGRELAAAVPTTRAGDVTAPTHANVTKVRLGPCLGPQPLSSGAPSPEPRHL